MTYRWRAYEELLHILCHQRNVNSNNEICPNTYYNGPKSRILTPLSADKNMVQQEISFIASGTMKLYSHFEKQFSVTVLTKLNILLQYHLEIFLFSIDSKEFKVCPHKYCLWTAALVLIAVNWEQPSCPR